MRFFRKPSFLGESGASKKYANPADQLRADVSALESELAASMKALADLEVRAVAAEARAMDAVQAGDDWTARACVAEHQAHAEKAAAIAADLEVLRAILDECHLFIDKLAGQSPPQS